MRTAHILNAQFHFIIRHPVSRVVGNSKLNYGIHLRYRFSRTARTSSSCSSCCVRLASAVAADTSPGRPTTASSGASPSTARCCHAFRAAVALPSEQLPSPGRPCGPALASFRAASSDCFHRPACCVPNRSKTAEQRGEKKSFCSRLENSFFLS